MKIISILQCCGAGAGGAEIIEIIFLINIYSIVLQSVWGMLG